MDQGIHKFVLLDGVENILLQQFGGSVYGMWTNMVFDKKLYTPFNLIIYIETGTADETYTYAKD